MYLGQSSGRGYSGKRRKEERATHHPDGTPTSARLVPQLSTHAYHISVGHLSRTPVLPTRPLSVTPRPPEPAQDFTATITPHNAGHDCTVVGSDLGKF